MNIITRLVITTLFVISTNTQADLVSRLGGLAYYDTESGLTWLTDAAYLKTLYVNSGGVEGDADGRVKWAQAESWVSGLSIAGVSGWRLPATFDIGNDGCNYSYSGTDCGFYVDYASGELANLFTNVLGNVPLKTGPGINDDSMGYNDIPYSGPFINVANNTGYYWSGTELVTDNAKAWVYSTVHHDQITASKTGSFLRAWPVYSGDIATVVPVPAAAWLFTSGLFCLIALSKRNKA